MANWRRANRRKSGADAVQAGTPDVPTQENPLPAPPVSPSADHGRTDHGRMRPPPERTAPEPDAPFLVSPDLANAYEASQSAELDLGSHTAPRHALPPGWVPPAARRGDGPAPLQPVADPTRPNSGSDPVGPPPGRTVGHQPTSTPSRESATVSQIDNAISDLLSIDGATGAAIVDISSGMALASGGNPGFDLTVAAAGNSNVIRAKLKTMNDLGLRGRIDDILITLDEQYHLINVLSDSANQGLFVYLVLNRDNANLALARHKLTGISRALKV